MRNFSKLKILCLLLFFLSTPGCLFHVEKKENLSPAENGAHSTLKHGTVESIATPENYKRIEIEPDSFSDYVRKLPLKPDDTPVLAFDGTLIKTPEIITAVIDWDRPSEVQQCADVAIRLRAEFLRAKNRQDEITFSSVSGIYISYAKWLHGKYGLDKQGKKIVYTSSTKIKPDSKDEFERYLNFVMQYANSTSLARDIPKIGDADLMPGDLYIQPDKSRNAGIGHVSVVLDVCVNDEGRKLYLFGYGFIPAQDFHLPLPDSNQGIGNWFTLDGYRENVSRFGTGTFHRFEYYE